MMRDAILNFPGQFSFTPEIRHEKNLKKYPHYVLVGMGGSHLSADLALAWRPELPLTIWNDYGLPPLPEQALKKSLIIAASYSGNTEEVIDACTTAQKKKYPLAGFATGGKLLGLATESEIPFIQIPDTGIQPRAGLGFMLRALLAIMRQDGLLEASVHLADTLPSVSREREGQHLAETLRGRTPVIYASRRNQAIAMNWKIIFNETGKIPAWWNVLPELNHNEMTGFDVAPSSKPLSQNLSFLLLEDTDDPPRVQLRMKTMDKLLRNRGFPVTTVRIAGTSREHLIFSSILLASWTALATAENYGLESEQVPMVEEFKTLIA